MAFNNFSMVLAVVVFCVFFSVLRYKVTAFQCCNKLMLSYFKYYIIKKQQLKVLWLCRCVQAWCFLGCGPTSGGVGGIRGV